MSKDQDKKKTVRNPQQTPAEEIQKIKSAELTDADLEQASGGMTKQHFGSISPPTAEDVLRFNTMLRNKTV